MDWTGGYASDVEYVAGFYREQAPLYLNFACLLNGFEPLPSDQPYNYFELGFGRGLTINVLAAANPNGKFYATDFNPAHVADAQQLADEARLENLVLLEQSFEDLAQGKVADLPQFDFITLHGVYTWVTAENRNHIVRFIARYLKPGGIVYISYNAMPGWAAALPVQRLLIEYAELFPNRSDFQVKQAAGFVESLVNAEAGFFSANPGLKPRLDTLKTGSPQYLVHEYMHKHWQPLYHADVVRDMHEAKLDFVGSADLFNAIPGVFISAEKMALVNSVSDPILRETLKDYMLNTGFRKDIFVRGARRISPLRQQKLLSQFGLALLVPRHQLTFSFKLGHAEVTGKPEMYGPVADLLQEQPMTLAELAQSFKQNPDISQNIVQIATLLIASDQVGLFTPHQRNDQKALANARNMNRVLAERNNYGDELRALVQPCSGTGINLNFVSRLVCMLALRNEIKSVDETTKTVQEILARMGVQMLKDGVAVDWQKEGLTQLRAEIAVTLNERVPLWQKLGMI